MEALREFGGEYGFSVDVIPPQEVDHDVVSSRTIRSLLVEEGRVEQATDRLGRPYRLQGVVSRGQGRGRKLGYPTANLALGDARTLVPKQGVYATAVTLPNGDRRGGMMNIGSRPTFDEMDVTVEVHLLDYEGDLYGASLSVEFLQRLRAEQKFESAEALAAQLSEDEERCRTVIRTQA